jgi:hypothetical protein
MPKAYPRRVIPGRRAAANPESMHTGLRDMDSGFGLRPPRNDKSRDAV